MNVFIIINDTGQPTQGVVNPMRIVIPGGTGHVGRVLVPALRSSGHEVIVLARHATGESGIAPWNGHTPGHWMRALDGADAVVNLAGRTVNCRYTRRHLRQMMDSRIDSTRAVGLAIQEAARPPRSWLQMSTATIYAHRFDAPNDEATGRLGGGEPDAPDYWRYSIDIATAWERTQRDAETPHTRKVLLRTAMVMSPIPGSVFGMLVRLTRLGLGGTIASGRQFVSWIHEQDFVRAVEFLLDHDEIEGPVNLAAPNPLPQRELMAVLRDVAGARFGLPTARWMAEVGAFLLRTDTELVLKSRRVLPARLQEAGFTFGYPQWHGAARELLSRCQASRRSGGKDPFP